MPESCFTHLFINHNKPGEANKAGGIVPMLHSFTQQTFIAHVLWARSLPLRCSQATRETTSQSSGPNEIYSLGSAGGPRGGRVMSFRWRTSGKAYEGGGI